MTAERCTFFFFFMRQRAVDVLIDSDMQGAKADSVGFKSGPIIPH